MKNKIIVISSIIFVSFGISFIMYQPYQYLDTYEIQGFVMFALMIAGAFIMLYYIILEIRKKNSMSDKDKLFWTIILITTNYFGFAFYIVFENEKIFK